MIAFEIFVNGGKQMTVGGDQLSFLNVLLSLIRLPLPEPDDKTLTLGASGITADQSQAATWPTLGLEVGDRVEIRVVEVGAADAPEFIQALEKGDDADFNAA